MLGSLRELVGLRNLPVAIDFSRVTKMWPSGTLLFLAEIKRLIWITKGLRRISCRRVHDRKVNQVLHQIGFYQAIRRTSKVEPTAEDVIHWRALSGTGAEGDKAGELVETVGGRLPEALNTPMYNGLVEAMTNCKQHAYIRDRGDRLKIRGRGEWWMFAQEHLGKLSVVFCDLGIGIPNSLPLTQGAGPVRDLLARIGRMTGVTGDADFIRAAVELGRSRSGEPHRGKGLQDVVDVIDASANGALQIFSNAGCYTYRVRDGKSSPDYSDFKESIMGTLIQWTVPIKAEEPLP